jgi:hypothetical protein
VADAGTMSIGSALVNAARDDAPASLSVPPMAVQTAPPVPAIALSSHQSALFALSHSVESMTDVDPNEVAARSRHVLTGPQSMIDVATERVEDFLSQQRDAFMKEIVRPGTSK